jgi:N-acetylmuramoyl-L-alanine amidase
MPALLIEVGYLTHPAENENLKRGLYLKRVASAISSGILRFAQRRKKPEAPHAIRRQAAR